MQQPVARNRGIAATVTVESLEQPLTLNPNPNPNLNPYLNPNLCHMAKLIVV